jgi:EmrB/QacA subfamily drug resistance transporter
MTDIALDPTAARTTSGRRLTAVVLTSVACLMVTLDALVVVTALPSIHSSLGGDAGGLQWIINAYNLTAAAGIVTGAALGDRFGRRRVFLAGLVGFMIASAAGALAPDLAALVACRAIQGLGAAVMLPVGLTLVTDAFPADRRGAAVGLWGGISGLGVAAGPLVGGAVTQGLDWHWVFWINVPIGLVALVGCARTLRESYGPNRPLDLPGMGLAAAALACLVAGLVDAPTTGWTAPRTVLLLVVAVAFFVGFLARESRTAAPMIPLRLFRVPAFTAASVANLFSSGAIFAAAYVMSEYFQLGRGDSPLGTGLRFLPWTAMPLVVAPIAGTLADRIGARRLAIPGLVLQASGFVAIVLLAGTGASWSAYVVPLVTAGVGVSLALPTLPAAALGAAPPREVGIAAGVVNVVQRVGAVIGVAVITAVFDSHGSLASSATVIPGFRWALAAAAALSLLGSLAATGIRPPAPRPGR